MMAIFDQEHRPPEADELDAAYGFVRAALSGIPLIGGAAVEILRQVIAPPLARRQQEWMADMAEAIRWLERDRGISLEQLRDNVGFIDTVLSASQAAVRTSQREKREALRNAVLNSALPDSPEVVFQQMCITWVDRFTELHLLLLKLFNDPSPLEKGRFRQRDWIKEQMDFWLALSKKDISSKSTWIEDQCPDLRGKEWLYCAAWADLHAVGLVESPTPKTSVMPKRPSGSHLTGLGDEFLRFIETPPD